MKELSLIPKFDHEPLSLFRIFFLKLIYTDTYATPSTRKIFNYFIKCHPILGKIEIPCAFEIITLI